MGINGCHLDPEDESDAMWGASRLSVGDSSAQGYSPLIEFSLQSVMQKRFNRQYEREDLFREQNAEKFR